MFKFARLGRREAMRVLFSSLLAAGLLTSQLSAAQTCARPADKTAFDVAGLKTQLMVTAITCEATERYNAFIVRYRSDLVAQEKVLTGYFRRNFGSRAQAQHDDYITSLANTRSQEGLKSGTAFCSQNVSLFDDVMKVRGGVELADFAAGKASVQPIALIACTEPERPGHALIRQASATTTTTHRFR
jgi:hypothetical protein